MKGISPCHDGFGIEKIAGQTIVVLENYLRMRKLDPSGCVLFDRVIEHIIDLCHGVDRLVVEFGGGIVADVA